MTSLSLQAHKLIRHYGRGHPHFITFTCYRRLPLLGAVRARNAFVQILEETRDRYGFSFVDYMVMPQYAYPLISSPLRVTLPAAGHLKSLWYDGLLTEVQGTGLE